MKKLIAVDLDGTLLNSRVEISPANKDALIKLRTAGHKLAIITGRHYHGSKHIADELEFDKYGGLLSSSNGANVYDCARRETIINHDIDRLTLREMIDYGSELGFGYMIYKDGRVMVETTDIYDLDLIVNKNHTEPYIDKDLRHKIDFDLNKLIFSANPKTIDKNFEKFKARFQDKINPIRSMPQFIDCMPKGIHKGVSLLEIAKFFDIDPADTIAFGDEMNDDTMIEMAGTGVAMGNANPAIKAIADEICPSNDDDGIAVFLKEKLNIL